MNIISYCFVISIIFFKNSNFNLFFINTKLSWDFAKLSKIFILQFILFVVFRYNILKPLKKVVAHFSTFQMWIRNSHRLQEIIECDCHRSGLNTGTLPLACVKQVVISSENF